MPSFKRKHAGIRILKNARERPDLRTDRRTRKTERTGGHFSGNAAFFAVLQFFYQKHFYRQKQFCQEGLKLRKTGSAVSKTGSLYGRGFAAVFMLCAAAAANLVSAQIRADRQAGSDFSYILDHMADRLVSSPLNISFEKPDIVSGLAAAAGIALIFLYKTATKKNYRDGEEEGSARWGNRKDISAFADPNPRNNLLMTKTERLSLDTHKTKRNLNALVIGSSGSGKTRSYVLPNLKNRNMNYAITDPKGEICAAAREELETAGYRVKILDLKNMSSNADKFNPLRYIDPDHSEKSIRELTENIISNTSAENAKNDQFWAAAERTLLTALISFAYYANWHDGWENETAEQTAKREPTLNDAADLLELADSSEQDENYASHADILMQQAQKIYDEARAAGFEGYDEEAKQTLEGIRFALRNYRRYSQGASETRKSIVISLGVRLSAMNIREVRELLSGDTMEIDKTDENKTAIFLTLSDTDTTFSFLAAIFYQCLFSTMIRKADSKPEQRLGRELHCFLDEFANIGKIPSFETLIATIRSRGISASIIIQNLAQLKALYEKQWETLAGNCDSTLFLGGNEETTTKWISARLGKATIDTRTTSQTKGTNGSRTINHGKNGRELLTADELGTLPGDTCIYMLRGTPPFISEKLKA